LYLYLLRYPFISKFKNVKFTPKFAIFITVTTMLMAALSFPRSDNLHMFEGLTGPSSQSDIIYFNPTSYKTYSKGSTSRLAVLLTDESSNWLGLAHGLKTIGIPFIITKDYERALSHNVVMVYPAISGRVLPADALKALKQHPVMGGTLIGTNVFGGGLAKIFGFENITESKEKTIISFNSNHELTYDFPRLKFDKIKIGNANDSQFNPGTNSYSGLMNPALATYENGDAAISYRNFDSGGRSFALGFDLGQLLLKGYNWRDSGIAEAYVNTYQPTLDALLKLTQNIYISSGPSAITLNTVPDGKSMTAIITHDIDYSKSIINAMEYAKLHADSGISATYFIQTKYIRDFNDEIFFNDEGVSYIEILEDLGMEIASHSVSHSLQFHEFPMGTGKETYPQYRPFVKSSTRTGGASLLGELRVSKFLLESFTQDNDVISFRPGFLRNPDILAEGLLRSGYKYSSSVTANKSLTHFPFMLNKGRAFESEIDIFEFPITVEDEKLPRMGDRLPEALAIADQLKEYGGTFVLLNHPDILGHKYEFEKGFIEYVKPFSWFGALGEYGDWWAARHKVSLDTEMKGENIEVTLSAPLAIEGLSLDIPINFDITGQDKESFGATQLGHKIVFPKIDGTIKFQLTPIH